MKNNIRIYGVKDFYIKYLSQYQEHLILHESMEFFCSVCGFNNGKTRAGEKRILLQKRREM